MVNVISATSRACSGTIADALETLAKKQISFQSFLAETSITAIQQNRVDAYSYITRFDYACLAEFASCSQHVADCCGDGDGVCTEVNPFDAHTPSWCKLVQSA